MACGAPLVRPLREERKVVTVVFADLVGFTSRSEVLDVEDVRALLRPFHSLVRSELERHGGTVEKFVGDAVVAVFGAPIAHEDDSERAVRAALAIRSAISVQNETDHGLDLHVRIGVNTGEAVVTLDARPERGEGIATGDVMNTAQRLQSAAPVDGILVGEATYRATERAIDYGARQDTAAKGKLEAVVAYEAVRARSRLGMERDDNPVALINRSAERDALVRAFHDARASRTARVVFVVGPPGIGKSRLLRELFDHVDRQPDLIRWRQSRSLPYGGAGPFAALVDVVKAEAGIYESDHPEAASEKLLSSLTALFDTDEVGWIESHLRALVGLEPPGELHGDRRAEAFAAWRRYLEAMAAASGLVLAIEDLHWANDALLDFVEHVVGWSTAVPLLVVCTGRPELLERRPGWPLVANSTLISVEPLCEAHTGELLDALSGGALPAETRSELMANAAGNPLYAREFLRMLVDRGLLTRDGDQWRSRASEEGAVPDAVLGIIAARIDALQPDDKAILQDAAVVGRSFWPAAVAAVSNRGRWAVAEGLRRLEQRQFVRAQRDSSIAGEAEFVFDHMVVRDVAYDGILRTERALKHVRAAEWLGELTGRRRGQAATLAYHYQVALDCGDDRLDRPTVTRQGSEALQAAGEHALGLHSYSTAARFFEHALLLCEPTAAGRPEMLLGRGLALAMAGQPADEALAEATRMLVASGDCERAAESESTRAWLLAVAGRMEDARQRDESALALISGRPASTAKALVLSRAGTHRVFAPDLHELGLSLLRDALAIAREDRLRDVEAETLQFVGMGRIAAGDADGVTDVEQALELALELASPVALSVYGNLADLRKRVGDLDAAAGLHQEGLRAAERFGIPWQVRRFRAEAIAHLYWRGEWDAAIGRADEYLEAVETGSPHEMEAETRVLRGRIRLLRGDVDGALLDAARALAFAYQTGHPYDLLPALAFATRVRQFAGMEGCGEPEAKQFIDCLRGGQPFWAAWALPDAVLAASALGFADELRDMLIGATPPTPWYEAAVASIDRRFPEAAEIYATVGAGPEEAQARLAAAASARREGRRAEAERQYRCATTFLDRIGVAASSLADASGGVRVE